MNNDKQVIAEPIATAAPQTAQNPPAAPVNAAPAAPQYIPAQQAAQNPPQYVQPQQQQSKMKV